MGSDGQTNKVEMAGSHAQSQRTSIEDAANDARNMFQINQDMELIDEKFASQEMCAFGARTADIKKQFTGMRKTQMEIFLKHMEIEMDFARPDRAEEEVSAADRGPTERGKKFQTKFEEKEGAVGEITEMLDKLGNGMRLISESASRSACLSTFEQGEQAAAASEAAPPAKTL